MEHALVLSTLEALGLRSRGAFHPEAEDEVPPLADGRRARTVVLVGALGDSLWPGFSGSPEYLDGGGDPLDRWSARVIAQAAETLGGGAAFPFGGPPHHPFLRWARRAEALWPSPLGLLIHPRHGLWHSYRGALLLPEKLQLPAEDDATSPCLTCVDQPCLSACPVGAFDGSRYHVDACAAHLRVALDPCASAGCLARAACPIGAASRYPEAQARFHISAFLRSRAKEDSGFQAPA